MNNIKEYDDYHKQVNDIEGHFHAVYTVSGPRFVVQHFGKVDQLDKDVEISDGESSESSEFARWDLLRGLIEKLPTAGGEQILQEYLDVRCLDEEMFDEELRWGVVALRAWGYEISTE